MLPEAWSPGLAKVHSMDGGPALSLSLPCSPRRPPSPFQKGFLSNLEEKGKINNGLYCASLRRPWVSFSDLEEETANIPYSKDQESWHPFLHLDSPPPI